MHKFLLPVIITRLAQTLVLALVTSISGWAAPAVVSTFTGGDPGEGLDLQGNFTYAVNVGPSGPAGKVGDADFTADNIPGVTVMAVNSIGNGGWGAVNYGATENDKNLSFVMNSIRWTAAPGVVEVRLAVEQGVEYKLQILEHEECCPGRGFNIIIDGVTEVTNFMPGPTHAGVDGDFQGTKNLVGAVITKQLVATSSLLTIILSGPAADSPDITDRNAILNGFTLERLSPVTDTDKDGLRDDLEIKFFGNLAQTGAGDFDQDGLTNAEELALGTNPASVDSDNDGLNDGLEVKTLKTDPTKRDTDGDFLSDGDEVNRYHTDPTKRDTDGDGSSDFEEVTLFTDPTSSQSKPQKTVIGIFTGADPGEGLDLQGTFPYAIDAATLGAAGGQVHGALFTDESAPGVTLDSGNKTALWNTGISYGDSPEDNLLEEIMGSISWSDASRVTVPPHPTPLSAVYLTLTNLEVGASYKLQLLFAEQQWPRGFDVHINGAHVANDFCPAFFQGGGFPLKFPDDRGVVLTHTFVANSKDLRVVLDGTTTTNPEFTDHNAIINAATLERVAVRVDSDNDTLPDAWEMEYFGNLAQTASQDPDGDGISNATEFADGTNPAKADTDNDGLSDSQEKTAKTNPLAPDSDQDGLTDGAEVLTYKTDPNKVDTDGDGWSDSVEINIRKSNPNRSETGATIQAIRGGDAGEGLDLDGKFIYAFSVGTENAAGQVRNANFTGETVEGVSITQATAVIQGWYNPDYGDTANDDVLEQAISSIRHGGGGIRIALSNLVAGTAYKLQLLFGEQCCARGMDVFVDGRQIADEFAPFVTMGGIAHPRQSAVITYPFFATKSTVIIQTAGATVTTPQYTDRNPIINAVTLEEVAKFADTDNDTLPDEWERQYFGNLNQTASGDPDNDGISNALEYVMGSDPAFAELTRDSDGDGLLDVDEVKIYKTDPSKGDSDADGLSDGSEVLIYKTDPAKADTDGDGQSDGVEITFGSDPLKAQPQTEFSKSTVAAFTGGDPGEGLDLQGTFAYALNIGTVGAAGKAGDATFTADNVTGAIVTAQNTIPNWHAPEYGDTANDNVVEKVMQSIRWSAAPARPKIELTVVPGTTYKLQLLVAEQCCAGRGYNIVVDGTVLTNDFIPANIQGGAGMTSQGAVFSTELLTQRDRLVIVLDGPGATSPDINDHNAILNGLTLEILKAAPPAVRISSIARDANGIAIVIQSVSGTTYTLEYKAKLSDATWQSAGSVTATGASTTIRDDLAAHRTGATGFWRLRTP